MLILEAAQARRAIAQTFSDINYTPDAAARTAIGKGVMRDLQARRLRPNVPVPSRRDPVRFVRTMYAETKSLPAAIYALFYDGSWTSSGGSFRLAGMIDVDIPELCDQALDRRGTLTYLEIGAGWAGLRSPDANAASPSDLAGLAAKYRDKLGSSVQLHFTNLTPWHDNLPVGVSEHPYITAAGLSALELQGVAPGSVDIIYSQAAAYFETDCVTFLRAAGRLLAPGGTIVFNHRIELNGIVDKILAEQGVHRSNRILLGGMNGSVVRFDRPRDEATKRTLAAYDPAFRRKAVG